MHVIPCKMLFEIDEDMLQSLQMARGTVYMGVRGLKNCSMVLLPSLNPACSSAIISSA